MERSTESLVEWDEYLASVGVVPIVSLRDPDLAVPLVDVLVEAGLPCVEITFRAAGAERAIAAVRAERPHVLVGAGTVLTVEQADAALDAGAHFLVAPGTNPRIVDHVLRRGGRIVPGIATPSEIELNLERGLKVLKFFPAEALGGTGFLRSVGGPFPDVTFVPSGGVSASNFRDYMALPNVRAVGGTWIAPQVVLDQGDLATVSRIARAAAAAVRELRPTTGVVG